MHPRNTPRNRNCSAAPGTTPRHTKGTKGLRVRPGPSTKSTRGQQHFKKSSPPQQLQEHSATHQRTPRTPRLYPEHLPKFKLRQDLDKQTLRTQATRQPRNPVPHACLTHASPARTSKTTRKSPSKASDQWRLRICIQSYFSMYSINVISGQESTV
jgi:hypothetical protein